MVLRDFAENLEQTLRAINGLNEIRFDLGRLSPRDIDLDVSQIFADRYHYANLGGGSCDLNVSFKVELSESVKERLIAGRNEAKSVPNVFHVSIICTFSVFIIYVYCYDDDHIIHCYNAMDVFKVFLKESFENLPTCKLEILDDLEYSPLRTIFNFENTDVDFEVDDKNQNYLGNIFIRFRKAYFDIEHEMPDILRFFSRLIDHRYSIVLDQMFLHETWRRIVARIHEIVDEAHSDQKSTFSFMNFQKQREIRALRIQILQFRVVESEVIFKWKAQEDRVTNFDIEFLSKKTQQIVDAYKEEPVSESLNILNMLHDNSKIWDDRLVLLLSSLLSGLIAMVISLALR